MAREIGGFQLPGSLRTERAPDLRVVIGDGRRLYFTLDVGEGAAKVYGGIDLDGLKARAREGAQVRPKLKLVKPAAGSDGAEAAEFGGPEGSRHTRVEISSTRIAQDLPLAA